MMNDLNEILVWAQMFFDDGTVSEGIRIPANIYDDDRIIENVIDKLLKSTNRKDEGLLVIWGAGEIYIKPISSSAEELDSSAS